MPLKLDKDKFKKLRTAIRHAHDDLSHQRKLRVEKIKQYVGDNYSLNGSPTQVPVNLLEIMITTYMSNLITSNPQALVVSEYKELNRSSKLLELALNHLIDEIDLKKTVISAVTDSFFTLGIAKIGLNNSSQIEIGGVLHDVGQPFADWVDFDNFVFDVNATSLEKCAYMGDRVKLPLDDVKNSGLYPKRLTDKLTPFRRNMDKTKHEGTSAANVSLTDDAKAHEDDYEDKVQLWNIFLPKDNLIVTMADDEAVTEPLLVSEWQGPERGPYRFLSYYDVPGNIIPLSPTSVILDLHKLTNKLFNKVGYQAMRQKNILGIKPGNKDGERIRDAADGEIIAMTDPGGSKEYRFGGPDQANMLFAGQARQLFSYMAGNLDAMGGLSQQADTARQESLIKDSSSVRLQKMQIKVTNFVKEILSDLAFYLWYDPIIDMPLVKEVAGYKLGVRFNAENREGDYLDYNIDIIPYSLIKKTPGERIQGIMGALNQLAPWVPLMQQQGINIDFEELVEMMGKYSDLPELKNIIYSEGADTDDTNKPVGQAPVKIEKINNEYKHTYESHGSLNGTQNMLAQQLVQQGAARENQMRMAGGM